MSAEDPAGQFTDLLIETAENTVPKTRFSKELPEVPWFDRNCKKAFKERKKAQRRCCFSNPMLSNVENCLLLKAKARHNNKRIRGDTPVLNSKMRTQKVWKAFRKVKGKGGSNSINHLKVNGMFITKTKTSGRSNSYKSV